MKLNSTNQKQLKMGLNKENHLFKYTLLII